MCVCIYVCTHTHTHTHTHARARAHTHTQPIMCQRDTRRIRSIGSCNKPGNICNRCSSCNSRRPWELLFKGKALILNSTLYHAFLSYGICHIAAIGCPASPPPVSLPPSSHSRSLARSRARALSRSLARSLSLSLSLCMTHTH